ncbi:response regulator [Dethiobacter alkaliphilus]|uniref:response regulator n=1 Tax=Dethiobacter alkaliphilus TaxID=427926 RepID=UPI00222725AF|nr:response regulator [Dethiobacter alkaliphilus]MCW3488895.1 response regulator [Dethiobacter alkaliphilus]
MSATIMVVDDRTGIRRLLQEVLQGAGYQVLTASGGNDALELVKENPVDLVLLDMKMAGMDGLETLTLLKKLCSQVIILIMTAYEELEVLKEASVAVRRATSPNPSISKN